MCLYHLHIKVADDVCELIHTFSIFLQTARAAKVDVFVMQKAVDWRMQCPCVLSQLDCSNVVQFLALVH